MLPKLRYCMTHAVADILHEPYARSRKYNLNRMWKKIMGFAWDLIVTQLVNSLDS